MKKLANKIYSSLPFLSFVFVQLGQMVPHIYRWDQCSLNAELYNMMKSPLEGSNFWYGLHKTKYDAFAFIREATLTSHISHI